MTKKPKVIIVGGGHNGLVTSFYLAQAGLEVQVLERRDIVGGSSVTEEWFPGFKISTCSYICHMLQEKIIDDLELRNHGLHIYPIDPVRIYPFDNGRIVRIWRNDEKTAQEIREFSHLDAKAWIEWGKFWNRAVRILSEYYLSNPPSLSQLTERFREEGEEQLLETLINVPLKTLVDRYFESNELRTIASVNIFDMGDISLPGSSYVTAIHKYGAYRKDTYNYGIVRGGMGNITQTMAKSVKNSGVSIRTGTEVKRILTQDSVVTGVEVKNSEIIKADVVVSNADPKRTFLNLLDISDLDDNFVENIRELKTESASAKFLCSIKELPDFSSYLGAGYDPTELAMIGICQSPESPEISLNAAREGKVSPKPILYVQIPSVYDKSIAPDGHHVLSMWVFFLPPHLNNGTWAEIRQQFGESLIDEVTKYAPNFRKSILKWNLLTPEDIEERMGLTDGNIRHIDMVPDQMMNNRPLPGWSNYTTPIKRLYLCGAGTHPGGEVTGAPGYNAAQEILRDLSLLE